MKGINLTEYNRGGVFDSGRKVVGSREPGADEHPAMRGH